VLPIIPVVDFIRRISLASSRNSIRKLWRSAIPSAVHVSRWSRCLSHEDADARSNLVVLVDLGDAGFIREKPILKVTLMTMNLIRPVTWKSIQKKRDNLMSQSGFPCDRRGCSIARCFVHKRLGLIDITDSDNGGCR